MSNGRPFHDQSEYVPPKSPLSLVCWMFYTMPSRPGILQACKRCPWFEERCAQGVKVKAPSFTAGTFHYGEKGKSYGREPVMA